MVTIYVFFFHFFRCVIELCAFDWIIYCIELSVASARYRLINLIKSKMYIYVDIPNPIFCLLGSVGSLCISKYDLRMTVWQADELIGFFVSLPLLLLLLCLFFSRCIHRKSVHIYNNMYGKRTCNVWLLPNFMNNSTFRQYEGKRLYISVSISFTHQSDECAYRKGKIVSRL